MLRSLAALAPRLFASVPNEARFPFRGHAHHHRHYTAEQFRDLLAQAGYAVTAWWGQAGPDSDVEPGVNGRTIVVEARRSSELFTAPEPVPEAFAAVAAPHTVAILGLGPSVDTYLGIVKRLGARKKLADEVWTINALGDVLDCDRVFHMDDVRIQEIRAAADPRGNIAAMLAWLKTHPGPVYTSRTHEDYPGLVEFPLADVLNSCANQRYFNSTAAYAVAFAIHLGVRKIICFGMDFTYPDAHSAEKGRGCVEFWLGLAVARGIELSLPRTTTLLDACVPPAERFYGYDTLELAISGPDGAETVTFTPRETLPSAEEIEARYDHTRHPNPLVSG
jgi:hypothetical protein